MKFFLLLLLIAHFFVHMAQGQVTFVLRSVPGDTPSGSQFYLAGTLNHWRPNHSGYEFRTDSLGRLSLTLTSTPDTFEFKVSRGSYSGVECSLSGRDIPNRVYTDTLGPLVHIDVVRWRDRVPSRELVSTATTSVHFTPTTIEMSRLNRRRTIRVYFPPDYSRRQGFPVVYMLDGQNLFDASTSFSGEWGIDETLDELYRTQALSYIVVGIYHGDRERENEHTPWANTEGAGGDGEKMARFIVRELKPYIDKHYRTLPDRDNTAIMGSSLGGLMAMYMALEYPDVFGRVGVFSPQIGWSEKIFEQVSRFRKRQFQKIYLVGGGSEEESIKDGLKQLHEGLSRVGFAENELVMNVAADGRHSEWLWGREFPHVLKWLFNH